MTDRFGRHQIFIFDSCLGTPSGYPEKTLVIKDSWGNVVWDSHEYNMTFLDIETAIRFSNTFIKKQK